MKKKIKVGFWELIARIVLKNRIAILITILALTIFLSFQWRNLGMTYTEANLLPKDHIVNQQYDEFLTKFGEEGNLIVIGFKDNFAPAVNNTERIFIWVNVLHYRQENRVEPVGRKCIWNEHQGFVLQTKDI